MTESKFSAASLTLLEAGFNAFSSFVTGVLEAFCWDFEPSRASKLSIKSKMELNCKKIPFHTEVL